MLVITRKTGERIRIGADVVVTIVSVRGSRVRVGIDAPSTFSIARAAIGQAGESGLSTTAGGATVGSVGETTSPA